MIVDWEAGRRLPPVAVLAAYERHFGLTPGCLLKLREHSLAECARAEARQSPSRPEASAAPAVLRQLPRPVAGFIGRVPVLAELEAMLGAGAQAPTVIAAVSGMAGVGKTSLAVHFAHKMAGQLD